MPKLEIFSIYDTAAEIFNQPFTAVNQAVAERMFGQIVNDPSTNFRFHPEDYRLYLVGTFDQHTGVVESREAPGLIVQAIDVLEKPQDLLPLEQLMRGNYALDARRDLGGVGGKPPTDASLSADVAGTDDAPRGRTMSDSR